MKKNTLYTVAVCSMMAGLAHAADIRYNAGGDWSALESVDGNGWQSLTAPGAGDTVRANWGGATITLDYATTVGAFQAAVDESGTFHIQSGGILTANGDSTIGNNGATATGTMIIDAGGTVNANGSWLGMGNGTSNTGVLTINGGTMNVAGHLWAAGGVGSTATININGGLLDVGDAFELGGADFNLRGTATLTVDNGGTLDLAWLHGTGAIQDGSVLNINGTGQMVIANNYVDIVNAYFTAGKIASDLGAIQATFADGKTTVIAIPEPATLGMVAAFGGAILFIRRRLAM